MHLCAICCLCDKLQAFFWSFYFHSSIEVINILADCEPNKITKAIHTGVMYSSAFQEYSGKMSNDEVRELLFNYFRSRRRFFHRDRNI